MALLFASNSIRIFKILGHGKAFAVKTNFPTDNDTEVPKLLI